MVLLSSVASKNQLLAVVRILLEQTKNLKILKTLAWKNKILNTTYAQQELLRYVGHNPSSLVIGNVQFISFKRFWAVCTRPGRRFTPFARAWPNVVVTENITKTVQPTFKQFFYYRLDFKFTKSTLRENFFVLHYENLIPSNIIFTIILLFLGSSLV